MSLEKSTDTPNCVVWLVNKGGHDYRDLEKYGRVIPLTIGNVNPFNPDRLMIGLGQHLRLAKANDYLAISGSPILNMLAIVMWLKRFPEVNILQHSTRKNEYVFLRVTNGAIESNLLGD